MAPPGTIPRASCSDRSSLQVIGTPSRASFVLGIVGTLVVAMYKSYGFVPDPVMIWTTGNNRLLGGFLAGLFASMVVVGYLLDRALPSRLKQIVGGPDRPRVSTGIPRMAGRSGHPAVSVSAILLLLQR